MSINQARAEYYSMTAEEKEHFTANLCESIFFLKDTLKERIIALMGEIDKELAHTLAEKTG